MKNFFQTLGQITKPIAFVIFMMYSIVICTYNIPSPYYIAIIVDTRMQVENGEQNGTLKNLVIECNQRIVAYQEYNKYWWADVVIPDAWDDIELIKWPEESHD